jgi:hypothetical protein
MVTGGREWQPQKNPGNGRMAAGSGPMKQLLLIVAAVALGLWAADVAEAGRYGGRFHGGRTQGGHYHGGRKSSGRFYGGNRYRPYQAAYRGYHLKYGVRFKYGYYYKGRIHRHWTKRYWNADYGCYVYYCPETSCYYYWCAPDDCYYPVTYTPYNTHQFDTPQTDDGFNDEDAHLDS